MSNNFINYLITDPKYYSFNPIKLKKKLIFVKNRKKVDFVCFRDKTSPNFKELAINFLKISKKLKFRKIFINSDINLAYRYKFDGVHLRSDQLDLIKSAKRKKLIVIASTHNLFEIKKAIKNRADFITYSPIFFTPHKGEPKGLNILRKMISKNNIKIIALGGIVNRYQIHKIKLKKSFGFASIRYFVK